MSNGNGKVPDDFTTVANTNASANTSTRSGLESIALVALQALQMQKQEQERKKCKVDEKENPALVTTTTTTTTAAAAALPPPLPAMDLATRVVSTETMMGDIYCVDESVSSHTSKSSIPPRVEETETVSSSLKAPNATTAPSSVDTDASEVGSSSPSTLPSNTTEKDSPTSTSTSTQEIPPEVADFSHILSDPEAWLRQTDNLFGKLAPIERSNNSIINNNDDIVVQPNDVLCGRGGETNHHPGNVRYRSLVKAYQKLYLLAKRREKPKIAQCIVVSVRGVNGRFLKRMKYANKRFWVDVGNVKAREKTSQALREGAPDLRDNVTTHTHTHTTAITTTSSNDNSAVGGRQVGAPDRRESTTIPSTTPTRTTTPTALEAMMGWRMSTASFNNSAKSTGSSSPVPPTSSSSTKSSLTQLDTNIDANNSLTAQAFTAAAAKLIQHPIFHQLDPAQQQQAILHELKVAKASASAVATTTAETATRTSASTATVMATTPANSNGQGRTSPMMTTASMQQQHPYYHPGQYHHYPHRYGHYPHDGNVNNHNKDPANTDTKTAPVTFSSNGAPPPQTGGNVDLQTMYRELLVAKAAVASGGSNTIPAANANGKKRSAPSSSSSFVVPTMTSSDAAAALLSARSSRIRSSPTVVSDTGSEVSLPSSSSSSITNNCESFSASSFSNSSNNNINNKDEEVAPSSASRRGSRVKRLKLRMQDDVN